MSIDFTALRGALGQLDEALVLWRQQAAGSALQRHLRSAVIQSFEFSYELTMRALRRVLIERAIAAPQAAELSFNDMLRSAADAGLLPDPVAWRRSRELRNTTSHADDEVRAQAVAELAAGFAQDARALWLAMESAVA